MSGKILRSTFLFSTFVLLAQVIGLVRDLYLVRFFGVGQILDTYYLAFKIPDFLNVFYSVFLGSVIFIPLLTKARHEGGEAGVVEQIQKVGSMVLVFILIASGLLYIFMPYLAALLAPTWSSGQLELLTNLSRTLILAQFFFPLGILAGCVGMVYDRPLGMAMAGAVYNFFILVVSILLAPIYGIQGVVIGIIIGSIFFAISQIYPKIVFEKLLQFKFVLALNDWLFFFQRNFGRFIAVLLNQTFMLSVLVLATAAGVGGVTIFSSAFTVFLAIFFIVGASFSTAIMPSNAKLHIEGNALELRESLQNSIIYMFNISVFIGLGAFVFAADIIRIIFHYSNLTTEQYLQISGVFAILVLSTPLLNVIEVVRKYLYATNMLRQSVLIMLVFLPNLFFWNFILDIYFIGIFSQLAILAFTIFIANTFTAIFILSLLNYYKKIDFKYILKSIYKLLFVIAIVVLVNFVTTHDLNLSYLVVLTFRGAIFLVSYLIAIYVLNEQISKNILRKLAGFFKKHDIVR